MQAMAPGNSSAPQAGHLDAALPPAAGGPGGGAGGRCGVGAGPPTAAPTGCSSGDGIVNTFLHVGQRTCLPAEPSGTDNRVLHFGHAITCGMVVLFRSL